MTEKSVFHIAPIMILGQSPFKSSLDLMGIGLEQIAEMVFEFGGTITCNPGTDDAEPVMSYAGSVGNCHIWATIKIKSLDAMLQIHAFGSRVVGLEPQTKLTIIDNSYFVF